MPRIGIVSNDLYANRIIEDIQLKNELLKLNICADIISWEDNNIDYSKYDCLILKSVWGYQKDYYRFKCWLEFIRNNGINLFNSVDLIENNIRKDIQFRILDENNIPHVPTIFQKEFLDEAAITNNQVIKPIISGGGYNTFRSESFDAKLFNEIMLEDDNGIMIQPFIKEIEDGEYSIIFIDGINTHNMMRNPGVFTRKQKPYQLLNVPEKVLGLAYRIKEIPEYKNALYMRVDMVNSEEPMVMEVELAEPDLLTRNIISEEPIKKLAKGLKRRI